MCQALPQSGECPARIRLSQGQELCTAGIISLSPAPEPDKSLGAGMSACERNRFRFQGDA